MVLQKSRDQLNDLMSKGTYLSWYQNVLHLNFEKIGIQPWKFFGKIVIYLEGTKTPNFLRKFYRVTDEAVHKEKRLLDQCTLLELSTLFAFCIAEVCLEKLVGSIDQLATSNLLGWFLSFRLLTRKQHPSFSLWF